MYRIAWQDGVMSEYQSSWVREQLRNWKGESTDRVFWSNLTEQEVRTDLSLDFEEVLRDTTANARALQTLYQYGILLVTNTPMQDRAVAALAAALGGGAVKTDSSSLLNHYLAGGSQVSSERGTDGPLRTLYGTVWSTHSHHQDEGTSTADSAYGHTALPLHTDMTYMRDPPGLQIFAMVQPAAAGGETVLADGFAAAERLRAVHPVAFDVLRCTVRTYRSVDVETGWQLEASGPVIATRNGQVTGIRHNDLDRLPDLPPTDAEDVESFYPALSEAHYAWDSILAADDMRLVFRLEAGETMVVVNQVRTCLFVCVSECLVELESNKTVLAWDRDVCTVDVALTETQ